MVKPEALAQQVASGEVADQEVGVRREENRLGPQQKGRKKGQDQSDQESLATPMWVAQQ